MATLTSPNDPRLLTPPAVWTAFARQGRWKNWVLALQFAVIGLMGLVNFALAARPPDVVLVSPDGKSTFVQASLAGEALTRWVQEQKLSPTDVTLVHFAREFLRLGLAVNSGTIAEAWPQTLSLCSPALRDRLARQAEAERLVAAAQAARIRTDVVIDDVLALERTRDLVHLRARLTRVRSGVLDEAKTIDKLVVDLLLRIVPRSLQHPDALEVAEWTTTTVPATPEPAHDP